MKNKRIFRTLTVLFAAVILTCGFSVTAYAGGGEDIPTDDSNVIVETEPQPLTPEGNMELIDDISGDASEDKQFIVVQSRGGDYFYIVIDKAAQGENTVHFLNQVDEADLMSIIEDGQSEAPSAVCSCTDKCEAGSVNTACPVCSTDRSKCAGKEAVTAPEDEPEPKEKNSMGGLVIFLIVALLGGGENTEVGTRFLCLLRNFLPYSYYNGNPILPKQDKRKTLQSQKDYNASQSLFICVRAAIHPLFRLP